MEAINGSTVIVLTGDQLREFAAEAVRIALAAETAPKEAPETPGSRFVYGLRGIGELFNVSRVTAQRYKNSFLAPAVMQRGRKIIVDVDKAWDLYKKEFNGR